MELESTRLIIETLSTLFQTSSEILTKDMIQASQISVHQIEEIAKTVIQLVEKYAKLPSTKQLILLTRKNDWQKLPEALERSRSSLEMILATIELRDTTNSIQNAVNELSGLVNSASLLLKHIEFTRHLKLHERLSFDRLEFEASHNIALTLLHNVVRVQVLTRSMTLLTVIGKNITLPTRFKLCGCNTVLNHF